MFVQTRLRASLIVKKFRAPFYGKRNRRLLTAISTSALAIIILIIVITAVAAGFAFQSRSRNSQTTQNTTSVALQTISQIAYSHWKYVSQKNLSETFAQYSTSYQAVWFFFNGSGSLSTLDGRHDCNPSGGLDCAYNVKSAWSAFYNYTPAVSNYSICGYNVSLDLENRAIVSATAWFELNTKNNQQGISTLEVPYEMDFEFINGSWQLWKEYFGLATQPALVFAATVLPPASCA